MPSFFEQLGLLKELELTYEVSQKTFIDLLEKNLDKDRYNPFEVFTSSHFKYKGTIETDGFRVKKKRRLFDSKTGWISATGKLEEKGNKLSINLAIIGWNHYMTIVYVFILIYCVFAFSTWLDMNEMQSLTKWLFLLFIMLLHTALLLLAPIILLRKSVKSLAETLPKDLSHLVKHGKF